MHWLSDCEVFKKDHASCSYRFALQYTTLHYTKVKINFLPLPDLFSVLPVLYICPSVLMKQVVLCVRYGFKMRWHR
jgi:hypothetical protein